MAYTCLSGSRVLLGLHGSYRVEVLPAVPEWVSHSLWGSRGRCLCGMEVYLFVSGNCVEVGLLCSAWVLEHSLYSNSGVVPVPMVCI